MYYVYQYIDPRNNKPFYIGKGTGDRKYCHLNETVETTINKRKFYRIQAIKKIGLFPIIEEIKHFQNEKDAYEFEEELIKLYGRKGYDQHGILMNITLGSRPPNRKGKTLTDEQKKKMQGKKLTESQKERLKGRTPWNKGKKGLQVAWNKGQKNIVKKSPMSENTKEKIRDANLGKTKSTETREKMSSSMKGRTPWNKGKELPSSSKSIPCNFISPDGEKFSFPSFRKGCIELKLPADKISLVKTGKLPNYKGWTVEIFHNPSKKR